ncbi:MAG: hypothetical protein KDD33_01960 [Bdellovibrionales bacterium]|nr:hypothetical protein [Bdellovibrionales bacterium]
MLKVVSSIFTLLMILPAWGFEKELMITGSFTNQSQKDLSVYLHVVNRTTRHLLGCMSWGFPDAQSTWYPHFDEEAFALSDQAGRLDGVLNPTTEGFCAWKPYQASIVIMEKAKMSALITSGDWEQLENKQQIFVKPEGAPGPSQAILRCQETEEGEISCPNELVPVGPDQQLQLTIIVQKYNPAILRFQ